MMKGWGGGGLGEGYEFGRGEMGGGGGGGGGGAGVFGVGEEGGLVVIHTVVQGCGPGARAGV